MMMMRLRIGYFVNNWAVKNGQRFLLAPILQMLFDQLRNILQRLKLFTGTQRQIFSRPPYFLVWITYHIGTTVIISFEGSADAAYASGATDKNSVYNVATACAGAYAYWFCRTQKYVVPSTSKAVYVALGIAVKELFWRQTWRFMLPGMDMPCSPVLGDNQSSV